MLTNDEIVARAEQVNGWMSHAELHALVHAVRRDIRPVQYVEVGSFRGRSAVAIYLALPPNSLFTAVDLYVPDYPYNQENPEEPSLQVMQRNMAACRDLRPDIQFELRVLSSAAGAALFPDRALDYVFIDADHEYDAVAADIAMWRPKIKPGGCLWGHDYSDAHHLDVARAVQASGYPFDVVPSTSIWRMEPVTHADRADRADTVVG